MGGTAQPVACAVGLEPDGDQFDRAHGTQGQGLRHLAGEQGLWLQTKHSISALLFIGAANVEDQFGATVRRDPLNRA